MAKLLRDWRFIGWRKVMSNSLSLTGNELLSLSDGYLVKASYTGAIIWIASGAKTATANNQTVAKEQYDYIARDDYTEYEIVINWGTITEVDVGKTYGLNANQEVDWTTEWTWTQLMLVRFISAAKWVFKPL